MIKTLRILFLKTIEKPRTRRFQESEQHTGVRGRRHKGDGVTNDNQTPDGMTGTWVQAEGGKWGVNR